MLVGKRLRTLTGWDESVGGFLCERCGWDVRVLGFRISDLRNTLRINTPAWMFQGTQLARDGRTWLSGDNFGFDGG